MLNGASEVALCKYPVTILLAIVVDLH